MITLVPIFAILSPKMNGVNATEQLMLINNLLGLGQGKPRGIQIYACQAM